MSTPGVSAADRERWRRVETICEGALERAGGAREEYVAAACDGDVGLRREVDGLLAQAGAAGGFLSTPAAELAGNLMDEAPDLSGRTIGGYEILRQLGAGGMGVVYLARDPKLGRDVAFKVLPGDVVSDPERLSRFRREAKLLATLSHPQIGAIHGFVEHGTTVALVLELLDGDTVEAILARGPMRLQPALTAAMQVAEALDHAHRRGITHRDLKPSNIMVTKTGAKLLDFGVGKRSTLDGSRPPGFTTDTVDGTLIGTLNYMAPEQLEGGEVGPRSDLFAFGAVLFEMITGQRAFDGQSRASIVAAVLHTDPPSVSTTMAIAIPARLDRVIGKCLTKDPDGRWQSARDLADELRWIAEEKDVTPTTRTTAPLLGRGWVPAAAALAIAIAALAAWAWRSTPEATTLASLPAAVRFVVTPPPNVAMHSMDFSISTDGRVLAYLDRRREQVFVRRLDTFDTISRKAVRRSSLAISPDSESIAFLSDDSLYRESLRGDSASVRIAAAVNGMHLDWTKPDTLFFSSIERPVMRVAVSGGAPVAVTELRAPHEVDHHSPRLLPDGNALLFAVHRQRNRFAVAVQRLDTGERKMLIEDAFQPTYLPTGHLVFGRGSSLLAVPFDLSSLSVTGTPITLVEGVHDIASSGRLAYQVSDTGTLVYHSRLPPDTRTLVWVDRTGKETPLPLPANTYEAPRLSPDGTHIAFATFHPLRVWTYEIATDKLVAISTERTSWGPVWTRDGSALIYGIDRPDAAHVVLHRLDGSAPVSIGSSIHDLVPAGFAADGTLFVNEFPPTDLYLISRLRPGGENRPQPFANGPTVPTEARPSPDGKWVAFSARLQGQWQVFVQPTSGDGPRRQITVDGGSGPVWRHDGKELYYRKNNGVFAVAIQLDRGLSWGKPVFLFSGRFVSGWFAFDVARDGRFLLLRPAATAAPPSQLNVVLNWTTELLSRISQR